MSRRIEEIDKNFAVPNDVSSIDADYYDVREEPFRVYGLYDYKNQPEFKRMPDDIGTSVNDGVTALYKNTAGGRIRFSTDSEIIILKAVMGAPHRFPHMPRTGAAGFDLYVDDPESGSRFHRPFIPPHDFENGYASRIRLHGGKKKRYITVNFPLYNDVSEVYIGVCKGATVGEGLTYRNDKPVVFYGSSITQGGCASRPGNCYQNIISRRMDLDYINLGFSGSGRAEDNIVEYMSKLPMCAFVSDYDHNAPNPEHLKNTHLKMYKKIREENPTVPYIMLSRCDFDCAYNENIERRDIIYATYRYARENGDQNVYYIDGASVFRGPYEDMCTVDGSHPNDLGFALLADAIGAELKRAFTQHRM